MTTTLANSKPHYPILDGLRGVAAILVVCFHLFEAHSTSHLDQVINHGYLAVDFFFVLSGFVVGYAYDDRWNKMTTGNFFTRRLIRLQPMVFIGMIIGACCFYFQGSTLWPGIPTVPVWKVLLVMVIGFTLIPIPATLDIRGWNEMHPLNGPGWSLFFEYIANILYGLFVRKFSNRLLSVLVILAGAALIQLAVFSPNGDIIGGWSLDPVQLRIGATRVMYPFFAGLLLSRLGKASAVKDAFLWCSGLILVVLAMPRIGGSTHLWMNGLYDSLSIILIFPLIVWLGAGGVLSGRLATRACDFLGSVSYPLYITHYPLIYIYTGWVATHKITIRQGFPYALLLLVSAIFIAWACLKFYDEPVRRWLGKKLAG